MIATAKLITISHGTPATLPRPIVLTSRVGTVRKSAPPVIR